MWNLRNRAPSINRPVGCFRRETRSSLAVGNTPAYLMRLCFDRLGLDSAAPALETMMKPGSPDFTFYLFALQRAPLFVGLDKSLLADLISLCHSEEWKKEEVIHREITREHFFLIVSGRVTLSRRNPENGREIVVFLLEDGDAFDVITLLDGRAHDAKIAVMEDTRVLSVPIPTARHWVQTHPAFNSNFLPYLGSHMRRLENLAADLALHDTVTRLANLILKHTSGDGSSEFPGNESLQLINDLSHEALSKMIGSVRIVVNRHLQKWKEEGIVDVQRKQIAVRDLEALREYCSKE